MIKNGLQESCPFVEKWATRMILDTPYEPTERDLEDFVLALERDKAFSPLNGEKIDSIHSTCHKVDNDWYYTIVISYSNNFPSGKYTWSDTLIFKEEELVDLWKSKQKEVMK